MRVCLAGTYAHQEVVGKKLPKYMLESFFYFQDWQVEAIKKCDLFLLDSGAFTFMNNYKGKVDWDEYIKKYANFINKYDIKYFFELDIDVLVGLEKVKEYRKELERLTGKKCIPVWHKSRGLDEWIEMCKNYDYVAIGGIVIKEIARKDYPYFIPLLKIAKKYNAKVHGLGLTCTTELEKYPFYSVDSTSWTSANRFAQMYYFNGKAMIGLKKPENSRLKLEKRLSALELSYTEWLKFQDYADKYL